MKKFKKLTAGLLGAVMALSVCSFTAFAEGLTLENGIDGPNGERVFDNVLFANGEDVTVEPGEEGGLIVKVGNEEFKYSSNTTDAKNGALTIFAGGNDDIDDNGEHSDVTIRIKDGAKVNTIFGGGYADSKTDNVRIKIDKGAAALNVYGGGLTSQGDGTSKAQVGNVDIVVDGKVRLLYAGGNSAVGPQIEDVVDVGKGTANNFVKEANVVINGEVFYYFGASFSYGGIGRVSCTVNGEINGPYSAVTGANGYTGSAEMIVNKDAVVNTNLYMAMRGYIKGDVVLKNYGKIDRVLLNPDGVSVSNGGSYEVINEGTINKCNIDCGCEKNAIETLIPKYPAYPAKITVSGDVTVTGAKLDEETNENIDDEHYTPVEGQTIYLMDGAKLADEESYLNVKVVADTVGETVVTTETDDTVVEVPEGVTLPDNFEDTIAEDTKVAGLENNVEDVVTSSDVDNAKEALGVYDEADIEIKVVTYLDIKVESYVNNDAEKTFTVDVTPMYRLEATSGTSTKTIKEGEKLDVTKEVEVTIPVHSGMFSADNLFVKHIHNRRTYYYSAELSDNKVTFTNPNGFSLITIFNDSRSGSIEFKNSDGNRIEKKEYNISNIGDKLPDYKEKGYTFKGWIIEGEVYDTFTEKLLNLINSDTFTATPKLVKNSSKPSHSYELEEGRVDRDDEDKEEPVVTTEPEEEAGPFSDVGKDNPNYDAIIKVYENGWMAGIGDGVFAPNGTLTRGMGAMVLWNKAGCPEPQNVAPFLDVTSDDWYAKAVAWAYEQGIVAGYGDVFGPDDALTTEQFTRMNDIANGKTPEIYVGGAPNATRGWVASLLAM